MQLARILAMLTPGNAVERTWPVPDPDLEIRGGGGPGHPDPYIRGEGGGGLVSKKNCLALRASVWFKKNFLIGIKFCQKCCTKMYTPDEEHVTR